MRARTLLMLVVASVVAVVTVTAVGAGRASAHNTFVSSEPALGAVLDRAPAQISFVFTGSVPLDTTTVQVIDASGARTALTGLTHGPAGDNELVAPLPPLPPGEITVRWRLVAPDGHPLTDRVTFTVRTSTPVTTVVGAAGAGVAPTTPPTTVATASSGAADEESGGVPGPLRWLLRAAAYVAIMALIGVVLTDGLVWPGALGDARLGRVVRAATWTVGATALLQFVVLAADIAGGVPGIGDLEVAGRTTAGGALVLRIALIGVAALLLAARQDAHPDVRWSVLSLTGAGLLGTWAFAGHAASQRWPHVGVSLDVVHHLGAALWIGSLAVVGLVAARTVPAPELPDVFRRLSRWAAVAVAVVVATGLGQSVRLLGGVDALTGTGHGRYLAMKLVLLAVMLAVANGSRRRVRLGLARSDAPRAALVGRLRRGILVELVLGLAIVGVTAAMVVSPPGVGA